MTDNDITKIADSLHKSPIFNLSLSAKELFHTNFLAWLCDTVPCATRMLFGSTFLQIPDRIPDSIEREKNNIDLLIAYNDGPTLVIENKVKSLPYFEQLETDRLRIEGASKNLPYPQFILLSLTSHHDAIAEQARWTPIHYGQLSTRLAALASSPIVDSYHGTLIGDYAAVVENLHRLSAEQPSLWCPPDPALSKLRLNDLFEKRKSELLATHVCDALRAIGCGPVSPDDSRPSRRHAGTTYVYHGLSRSTGLVGCVRNIGCANTIGDEADLAVAIGVQVQDEQFRSFIEFGEPGQPSSARREARAKAAVRVFESVNAGRWWTAGKPSSSGKKDVCQFGGTFFYRYLSVNSVCGAAPQLEELAAHMASTHADAIDQATSIIGAINRA